METGTKALLYGLGALVLSAVIILSATSLGLSPASSAGFNPVSPNTLSILLTDPPSVPSGVTAVYVSYSNLALRVSGAPASNVLVRLNASGTLDTLGLVNLSRTISTQNVPSGRYGFILFRISGVSISFLGQNYTATVNNPNLVVPIVGGLVVNGSSPSAVLVDIQPSVVNLGSQSNPRFFVTTGSRALQVPRSEIQPSVERAGHQESLKSKGWYSSFVIRHSERPSMGAVSLTPNSFSLTLTNPTTDNLPIRAILLTPDSRNNHAMSPPPSLADSVVFTVRSDGSLTLVHLDLSKSGVVRQLTDLFSSSDYLLDSNGTATFTFSGEVTASFLPGIAVTTGSVYYVSVLTNQVLTLGTVQSG